MLISQMTWFQVEDYLKQDDRALLPIGTQRGMSPAQARAFLGDGNFGGFYQRPDEDMVAIWQVAVEETRELLISGWP